MEILLLVLYLIALAYVGYILFKVIWYAVRLLVLRAKMKRLDGPRVRVQPQRAFRHIVFGKREGVDYVIHAGLKKYEVYVITFLSWHGRWNIEKGKDGYFVECRRASKIFHGMYTKRSREEYTTVYRNEYRVKRRELALTPRDDSLEKQILLLYPWPQTMTYTDSAYHEMIEGDCVDGYVLMSLEGLAETLLGGERKE